MFFHYIRNVQKIINRRKNVELKNSPTEIPFDSVLNSSKLKLILCIQYAKKKKTIEIVLNFQKASSFLGSGGASEIDTTKRKHSFLSFDMHISNHFKRFFVALRYFFHTSYLFSSIPKRFHLDSITMENA